MVGASVVLLVSSFWWHSDALLSWLLLWIASVRRDRINVRGRGGSRRCRRCGHPVAEHYPNFKDGWPISFYCGVHGFGGCKCVRPAHEIEWEQLGEKFVAVTERA